MSFLSINCVGSLDMDIHVWSDEAHPRQFSAAWRPLWMRFMSSSFRCVFSSICPIGLHTTSYSPICIQTRVQPSETERGQWLLGCVVWAVKASSRSHSLLI